MKTPKALLILAAAAAASSIYADRIPVSQTPPAVQNAIRTRAGGRQINSVTRNLQNGHVTYDVSWRDNSGAQQEVVVSEVGTILRDIVAPSLGLSGENLTLANRTGVAVQDLPRAVQDAIHGQLPDAPIDGVQRGIWNGQNIYEVTYHDNGRLKTVQITETGQPVVSQVPAATQIASTAALAAPVVTTPEAGLGSRTPTTVTPTAVTSPTPPAVTSPAPPAVTSPVPPAITSPVPPAVTSPVPPAIADTTPGSAAAPTTVPTQIVSPVPPVTTPPGIPNTAAAATQLRFAGLAESNVPIVAGSRMSVAEAPREVQHTVQQLANGARIEEFQRGWWNGQIVYEAAFRRNGQDFQVQVLDNGMILTTPPNATGGPAAGVTGTGQP